jgi:hypothetical protein
MSAPVDATPEPPRIPMPLHAFELAVCDLRCGDVVYRRTAADPAVVEVLGVLRLIDRHPSGMYALLFESSRPESRHRVLAAADADALVVVRPARS